MKTDFIPLTQGDLDTWEVNFKQKVADIVKELKLDATEAAEVNALIDSHRVTFAAMVSIKADAKSATSKNNEAEKLTLKAIRELAGRIKGAKGYTEAMGNSLRIIGSDSVFNKSDAKPVLVVSKEANYVVVKFIKDRTDGVHIYGRRGDEKEFSFLAVDTSSPYNDTRPNLVPGQSEVREYKAWHFKDDAIIGQESDVVSIAV